MTLGEKFKLWRLYRRMNKELNKNEVDLMEKLKSRKLWAAVASAVIAVFGREFNLSPETVNAVVVIAVGYIVGQSGVDAAKELKKGGE